MQTNDSEVQLELGLVLAMHNTQADPCEHANKMQDLLQNALAVLGNTCLPHQLSSYAVMLSRYSVLCDVKRPTMYHDREHEAFNCSSYEVLCAADLASALLQSVTSCRYAGNPFFHVWPQRPSQYCIRGVACICN